MRPLNRRQPREERYVDPSPSIWAYRFERLRLTPSYRRLARYGLPVVVVALILGGWLGNADNRAAIGNIVADLRSEFVNQPDFLVREVALAGASARVSEQVRERLALSLPVSNFDLDLDAMRATLLTLPAVSGVALRVQGDRLDIQVEERQPVLVWRKRDGLTLLDREGVELLELSSRAAAGGLPLVAGEGAQQAVPEALALLRAAAPVQGRVRGLVRVGQRRWDLVLDRQQRILLPSTAPVEALERVMALHQARDMLGRDVTHIDMRLGARPTLRLTSAALGELEKIRKHSKTEAAKR